MAFDGMTGKPHNFNGGGNDIIFATPFGEMVRICGNGDIKIHGILITTNTIVYEAMVKFLRTAKREQSGNSGPESDIILSWPRGEILRMCHDGRFLVHGLPTDNAHVVVGALKDFLITDLIARL